MKNIWVIMKKELKRFFTDKRMVATLVLPGILIFVMYSLMGNIVDGSFKPKEEHQYIVYVINQPTSAESFNNTDKYKIKVNELTDESAIDDVKVRIENKEVDILIQYEKDFTTKVNNGEKPSVSMFYNSVSNESKEIYGYYNSCLSTEAYEIVNNFFINADEKVTYDLATKEDTSAKLITMMLPFLLVIFLFSGCMAISTESIAGEKERGTIATLLVTPVKRGEIALGKILALSLTALASSIVSFIGLIASMPKLFGGLDVDMNIYGVGSYAGVLGVIIVTVILFTVILSLISTFAKSIKEASQLSLPVMVVVMAVGVTSFMGITSTGSWCYFIPVYNSICCLTGIFGLEFNTIGFLITILSNIAFIGLGIFALTKMFKSEKIMFNK